MFTFNIVSNDGKVDNVVVLLNNGSTLTATTEHPNFNEIVLRLRGTEVGIGEYTDEQVTDWFDVGEAISRRFVRLTERVLLKGNNLFFDGDEVNGAVVDTIVRYYTEGRDDFAPLVCFLEKIATNPSTHSRDNLFRWMAKNSFGLAFDGDVIAYKGVDWRGEGVKGGYFSKTAGSAIVNGEWVEGVIPNDPGTIIEMPRSDVTFDPSNGCSTGLHVANYSFANTFAGYGGKVLKVKINPRDVVSVPVDSYDQKMRVCRYKVIGEVESEDKGVLRLQRHEEAKTTYVPGPTVDTGQVAPRGEETVTPVEAEPEEDTKAERNQRIHNEVVGTLVRTPEGVKHFAAKDHLPSYYEDFTRKHWRSLSESELQKAAKLLEVEVGGKGSKRAHQDALTAWSKTQRAAHPTAAAS